MSLVNVTSGCAARLFGPHRQRRHETATPVTSNARAGDENPAEMLSNRHCRLSLDSQL